MNCPFCNGWMGSSVRDMFQCEDCGLFRKGNIPTPELMKKRGRDFMLSACFDSSTRDKRMAEADNDLQLLETYIEPGKMLDVGAAGGFMMKVAMDRGWLVRGCDISERSIEWAAEHFDISIEFGMLRDIELTDGEFDVVVFWNTLEHLLDPAVALRIAKMSLKAGGFIYLKVPVKNRKGVVDKYEELHTTEFGRKNLSSYLSLIGFDVVKQVFYDRGTFSAMLLLVQKR